MSMSKVPLARRSATTLIASLLVSSALLRIAFGDGTAIAEGNLATQLMMPDRSAEAEPEQTSLEPAEITTLLGALNEREARVADAETQLAVRKKALDIAQVEIERRLVALEHAEKKLAATMARAQTASEDDIAKLTAVYENMKPKEAAELFETMEPEFAAGFMARMRPDVAAKILSGLDPTVAYSISAILAGRNAKAPKS